MKLIKKIINDNDNPTFDITLWKVEGKVDYEEFDVELLSEELISIWDNLIHRVNKSIVIHPWIRGGLFISHRKFYMLMNLI